MALDAISFNNIPGSGLVAPIFTAEVNSGGQYSNIDRFVILGFKTNAGTMSLDTLYRVSSIQEADQLAGPRSLLRELVRVALRNAPALPLFIMATATTGLTAQVKTITIVSPGAGTGYFDVQGERLSFAVSSTDTATTVATAIAAAINVYYNPLTGAMLPYTATSSAGVVTITASVPGAIGQEFDIHVPARSDNVFNGAGVFTLAQTTAGSGNPSALATTLAALGDAPADMVVAPWSDATSLGVYASWSNDVSGRWAWSRQSYGHIVTSSVGSLSTLTTLGASLNDRHLTIVGLNTAGTRGNPYPSWMLACAAAARLFPWLTDIATGRIGCAHDGLELVDVKPPRDASAQWNYNARNALNSAGISTLTVAADGTVLLSKMITTYQTGAGGNPDTVFRDIQSVFQVAEGLKYLRAQLATLYGRKALVNVNPSSLAAAVTPADIKAGLVALYTYLCSKLVFQDADTFAQLVKVQINGSNPNRVDVFLPLERVNPLDILAMNATIYQVYPNTDLLPVAA